MSSGVIDAAQALRETLHRWPREKLRRAMEIAEGVPEPQARHDLMLRVILRLHGEEREQALSRLMSSIALEDTPEGRVAIYRKLMEQGWRREAVAVVRPLLEELEAMPSPDGYALCGVVPWLDAADLDRAIAVAACVDSENARAEALAALLDRPDLSDRIVVARALRVLMPLWDISPARRTAIMEAMAGSIPRAEIADFLPLIALMPEGRDVVLAQLAGKLDASVEDAAIALAMGLPDERLRRGTLSELATHALPRRARKLLAHVLAGGEPGREEALRTIVAALPPLAIADIVDWVHSDPEGGAIDALVAALPRVPTVSLDEARSLLRTIQDPRSRGRALVEYAVHAAPRAGVPRGDLLSEACWLLDADPKVVTFFRTWGDRLVVISVEEVFAALHAPARLLRLVWPNIAAFGEGAPPSVVPFLRSIAPASELVEILPAIAAVGR